MGIEILFRRDYTSSPFRERLCTLMSIKGNKLLLSSGYISISLFNNHNLEAFVKSLKAGFVDTNNFEISIIGGMLKDNIDEEVRFITFTKILQSICKYDKDLKMKKYVVDLYVPSNKKWHAKVAIKGAQEIKDGKLETDIYSIIIGSSNLTAACFSVYYPYNNASNDWINHECDVFMWNRYKLSNANKVNDASTLSINEIESSATEGLYHFLMENDIEVDLYELKTMLTDIDYLRFYITDLIGKKYKIYPYYNLDYDYYNKKDDADDGDDWEDGDDSYNGYNGYVDNPKRAAEILECVEYYLHILFTCYYAKKNENRYNVVKVKLNEKEIKNIMADTYNYLDEMRNNLLIIKKDIDIIYQDDDIRSFDSELKEKLAKGNYDELNKLIGIIGRIETVTLLIKLIKDKNGKIQPKEQVEKYTLLLKELGINYNTLIKEINKLDIKDILNRHIKLFKESNF